MLISDRKTKNGVSVPKYGSTFIPDCPTPPTHSKLRYAVGGWVFPIMYNASC